MMEFLSENVAVQYNIDGSVWLVSVSPKCQIPVRILQGISLPLIAVFRIQPPFINQNRSGTCRVHSMHAIPLQLPDGCQCKTSYLRMALSLSTPRTRLRLWAPKFPINSARAWSSLASLAGSCCFSSATRSMPDSFTPKSNEGSDI